MDLLNDEILDDLHEGVEALRVLAQTRSIPLSNQAILTLQRLENSVPVARQEFRLWKQTLAQSALKAAQKTDEAIHKHPWFFALSALSLGFLIGLILFDSEERKE